MQGNKSSRVFLLASLVLGVLATIIAFAYLDRSVGQRAGPTVAYLFAATDLSAGAAINPDRDLRIEQLPSDLPGGIEAGLSETLRGQRVTRPVRAGQPFLYSDIGEVAELRLAPNMRAISIPARGAHALSGLLVPGDYVTLMVTRPLVRTTRPIASANPSEDDDDFIPSEMTVRWETTTITQEPLKVLAVGPRLTRQRQQLLMADQYDMATPDSQQTVTLEVTEDQARTILEQTGAGQLPVTLILNPPPER
jgi:Flp pilus assembly protein CpaB